MAEGSIVLDGAASILFIGNSYTFGRVDPVMHYNAANVRDLTAPVPGTSFANTTGSNPYEPHPWGGVPGVFKAFADETGLTLDVALSARNAATLQGHYLNSNPAGWDLRGNLASQAWDTVVLQDNSTQALHSGTGSITFAPGASTATLTLSPVADAKVEADETVGLQLAAGTGYRAGTTSTVTGTILNDDPTGPSINPALPTVTLTADPAAAFEDAGGKLVYTFTRTGTTDTPLTIQFKATRDGSTAPSVATTSAGDFVSQGGSIYKFESGGGTVAGTISFTSNTGSVTIAAGATSATLTLLPKADGAVEGDESLHFTLSANAAYNVGTQGAVTATILDDDFAGGADLSLPNVTLSLSKTAVYEDGTEKLVYEFARTGPTAGALTVNYGVSGSATLPGGDFAVTGATTFTTAGASDPDLASFQTYATKLAQYAKTGAADGAVPANPHADAATDVYLYETWARPNLVAGARVATTDDQTGAITTTGTTAPEYYASLEDMTADLRAAYEGLAAANPIFKGVAPVGAAFLSAVQNGTALRDPYATNAGTDGKVDLWWDDNLHASKYGSYLSALTLFGTITGVDPRSLGAADKVAADLGINPATAGALQGVAAATVGFTLQAHWTAPGQVTELAGGATGLLATAGAFSFSDADATDVHTVSVATETPGALGHLTAVLHSDTTGDGSGGAVNWTYTVDDAAVQGLAAGETQVERFLVTVSDQHGGEAQREIAVTINGVGPVAPGLALAHDTGASASDHLTSDATLAVAPAETGDTLAYSVDGSAFAASYDTSALADGSHTVAVTQTDAAGNISAASTLGFALDTHAPTLALSGVSGPTNHAGGHVLAGSLDLSNFGTTDAGLSVTLRDGTTVLGTTMSDAGGHFTFALPGDTQPGPGYGYSLSASATDAAGNAGASDTFSFVLDYTPNQALFGTIEHSAQCGAAGVYALYEALLDRAPDALGLEHFVATLHDGASLDDVAQAILVSTERGAQPHNFNSYVTGLYTDLLHRLPDDEGLRHFTGELNAGVSQAHVAVEIATSAEAQAVLGPTFQAGVFVADTTDASIARLYYGLLGRAPDGVGLAGWEAAAKAGVALTSVAQGFLGSPEYAAGHAGQTDGQFVDGLYGAGLGRAADTAGEASWLDRLAHGATRADVAVGIMQSPEAQAHWAGHVEQGWHLA